MNYQLFVPDEYEANQNMEWPIILFLHGNKKRGDNIHLLDDYGLNWTAERKQDFKFIVVTPQCPESSSWPFEREAVLTLLDEIISTYRVDRERVYLVGFSMGGNGAWDLAAFAPERFAAVVPISGWFDTEKALLLKDIPIWAFHGEDDDVVSIQGSEDMVAALKGVDGDIKFTSYPNLKHFIMDETFSNPDIYTWMLSHKRLFV